MRTQLEQLKELVEGLNLGNVPDYKTKSGHGQNIPLLKPAQQLLSGLGVTAVPNAKLSKTDDGIPLSGKSSKDVTVSSLDKTDAKLSITGARSDELLGSAKIYVNRDIISKAEFTSVVAPETLTAQTEVQSSSGEYLQNLAVGICHAQKVDLLAEPVNVGGQGILGPRSGIIDAGKPAILLLSNPALNLDYGVKIPPKQQAKFIGSIAESVGK